MLGRPVLAQQRCRRRPSGEVGEQPRDGRGDLRDGPVVAAPVAAAERPRQGEVGAVSGVVAAPVARIPAASPGTRRIAQTSTPLARRRSMFKVPNASAPTQLMSAEAAPQRAAWSAKMAGAPLGQGPANGPGARKVWPTLVAIISTRISPSVTTSGIAATPPRNGSRGHRRYGRA
jgi:hypothetical protein